MNENQRIYALFGNVSSGKSTLAKKLSEYYSGIPRLSSDAIREELTRNIAGPSPNVFETMRNRLNGHLAAGSSVILDSTGMSAKYVDLLKEFRDLVPMYVIQLHNDKASWQQREKGRTDRWKLDDNNQKVSFQMPERAYNQSSQVSITPDLKVDTTNLTPDDVFSRVLDHINGGQQNGLYHSSSSKKPQE